MTFSIPTPPPQSRTFPAARFLLNETPILMRILLALSLSLTAAQGAAAQTFTATVSALRGGTAGERTESQDLVKGFNLADCGDPSAELVLEFNRTPTQFDLWHNDGSSIDCTLTDNRQSNANDRNCVHITTSATPDMTNGNVVIPLADIAAGDPDSGKGTNVCSRDRTTYTFLIISTSAAIETGEISEYATFNLTIDAVAPSPPTFTTTSRTGNRITLSWDAVSDVDMVSQLRYVAAVNDQGCGLSVTEADAGASDGGMSSMALITNTETNLGETSITLDLGSLGIADGNSAGVRVATIDQAGNQGTFSNEVCLTRQTGLGPCDVLEGGCGDGCSVSAPLPGGSPAPLAVLALALGLALRRGRR